MASMRSINILFHLPARPILVARRSCSEHLEGSAAGSGQPCLSWLQPRHELDRNTALAAEVSCQPKHLRGRRAANLHALAAAMLTPCDLNSRERHLQTLCQQAPQRFVGLVIHRRRRQPHPQRALPFPGNLVAAGPRLHTHRKTYAAIFFANLDHALWSIYQAPTRCGSWLQPRHKLDRVRAALAAEA